MRCLHRFQTGTPCRFEPTAALAAAAPARRCAGSAPSPPRAVPVGPHATLHVFQSYGRPSSVSFGSARLHSQLSSLISFGCGAPLPVSRSDFRLSKKTAHLVLQWCMNSTASFQPWCLNRTTVQSPFCLRSKLTLVPSHSSGPSATCHRTRLPGCSSRTFMSKPPPPKRNWSTPPTLLSPCVSLVHQRERPSTVAKAL